MMRNQERKMIFLIGLWSILLLHTVSMAEDRPKEEHPPYLRLARNLPVESINPLDKNSDRQITSQLFAGLVEVESDPEKTWKVVPSLAKKWALFKGEVVLKKYPSFITQGQEELFKGAAVYIFHLRKNVQWSDGRSITANDVVEAMQWHLLRPDLDATDDLFILKNARKYSQSNIDKKLLGVQKIDDHTLCFILEDPTPLFPLMTSLPNFRPLPVEAIKELGEDWMHPEDIVVSGPYSLKRWRKRNLLILKKNPHYFDASKVQIPEIHYTILPSSEVALEMFKQDQLDFIQVSRQKLYSEIKKYPNLTGKLSNEQSRLETWYLGFDLSKPPFNKIEARQAVASVIKKEPLLKKVLGVLGKKADTLTSPSSVGHVDHPPDDWKSVSTSDDSERIRELFKQANSTDHDFSSIKIFSDTEDGSEIAMYIKETLGEVLNNVELAKEDEEDNAHLFVAFKEARLPHAHYFLSEFSEPDNKSGWNNQKHSEFSELLRNALTYHTASQKQKDLYQKAEKILYEEIVIISLFFREVAFLAKPWLIWTPSKTDVQQIHNWSFKG